MAKSLDYGLYCIVGLTEIMHCNPIYPNMQNIYISKTENEPSKYYDGNKWLEIETETLINDVYYDKNKIIINNFDKFSNELKLSDARKKEAKRGLTYDINTKNNILNESNIKNEVKMVLVNNSEKQNIDKKASLNNIACKKINNKNTKDHSNDRFSKKLLTHIDNNNDVDNEVIEDNDYNSNKYIKDNDNDFKKPLIDINKSLKNIIKLKNVNKNSDRENNKANIDNKKQNKEKKKSDRENKKHENEIKKPNIVIKKPDKDIKKPDKEIKKPDKEIKKPDKDIKKPYNKSQKDNYESNDVIKHNEEKIDHDDEEIEDNDEGIEHDDEQIEYEVEEIELEEEDIEDNNDKIENDDKKIDYDENEDNNKDHENSSKKNQILFDYGNEKLDFLTEINIYNILIYGVQSIEKYLYTVHCNDEHAKYKNIYVDEKNKHVYIYTNSKWEKVKKDYINKLFDVAFDFIKKQFLLLSKKINHTIKSNVRFCECYCVCNSNYDLKCNCIDNTCKCADIHKNLNILDKTFYNDKSKKKALQNSYDLIHEIENEKFHKLKKDICKRIRKLLTVNKP